MLDEKILSVLRNNTDSHVSGEELCKMAGISRAAIWKHVEKLRAEGYDIEASPHLGYRLKSVPDALIPSEVKWALKTRILGKEVISYKRVDSTNAIAYKLAEGGIGEGAAILAEEQVKGKGRHGRHWSSPPKGGIYLSCVLRPKMAPNEISRITLLAAVAVAKAVRAVTSLNAVIKWPNDILVNGKKVCGILTEMKAEQDNTDFVILGIGINVNTGERSLPDGASSLREELPSRKKDENISRIELVQKVLENLEEEYIRMKDKGFEPIIDEWKHLSDMLGARVRVTVQDKVYDGHVHDIDTDGALVLRRDSGVMQKISSGDVIMTR